MNSTLLTPRWTKAIPAAITARTSSTGRTVTARRGRPPRRRVGRVPQPGGWSAMVVPFGGGLFDRTAGAQRRHVLVDLLSQWGPGGKECLVRHAADHHPPASSPGARWPRRGAASRARRVEPGEQQRERHHSARLQLPPRNAQNPPSRRRPPAPALTRAQAAPAGCPSAAPSARTSAAREWQTVL
jgi:hypothetical protein